jgi:hypothetical protein
MLEVIFFESGIALGIDRKRERLIMRIDGSEIGNMD